jgi:hypothetical protein
MDSSALFLLGLALTVLIAAIVAAYLRSPLRQLLAETNGHRVAFWAAYFNIIVVLIPLFFAMLSAPGPGSKIPAPLALAQQIRWSLLGLSLSLLVAGRILRRKTARPQAAAAPSVVPPNTISEHLGNH